MIFLIQSSKNTWFDKQIVIRYNIITNMFGMPNSPFEKPAPKGPAKKEEPVRTLREKVTEARREQAQMSPAEREAERLAYIEQLKHGGKVELTPEEREAREERERRARELREQQG